MPLIQLQSSLRLFQLSMVCVRPSIRLSLFLNYIKGRRGIQNFRYPGNISYCIFNHSIIAGRPSYCKFLTQQWQIADNQKTFSLQLNQSHLRGVRDQNMDILPHYWFCFLLKTRIFAKKQYLGRHEFKDWITKAMNLFRYLN